MQHLQPIPAEEMVATFLRTELTSPRFEPAILTILQRDGRDRSIIEHPDLANPADNAYRAQLLGEHRGYGRDEDVFTSVPLGPAEMQYSHATSGSRGEARM